MNSKRSKEIQPNNQPQDQEQDISSIWSSLGRLRAELRRMEHRLDDAGEAGVGGVSAGISGPSFHHPLHHYHQPHRYTTSAAGSGASMPGVSSSSEQSSEAAKHSGAFGPRLPQLSGTRRKVSRIDDKSTEDGPVQAQPSKQRGHRGEPISRPGSRGRQVLPVNHDHHGYREESPKRVDFSKTHQLREVNWDGTYHDSLAYNSDFTGSGSSSSIVNSTVTNSRDIRETDIHFLNFSRVPGSVPGTSTATTAPGPSTTNTTSTLSNSHKPSSPPFAPPPSVSNSAANFHLVLPPGSTSSSPPTSSLSSDPSPDLLPHTQQPPDVRWAGRGGATKPGAQHIGSGSGKSGYGRNSGPKLTHVDLQVTGSARTGHSIAQAPGPSLTEQKHKEFLHARKEVEERWASSSSSRPQDKHSRDSSLGRHKAMDERKGATGTTVPKSALGAVGGAESPSTNSPKRQRPVKLAITADLKEDEIMLKLKERLKHQRALASSSSASGSNDTSLADTSGSSATPPALPPRQPLTDDLVTGVPLTRKVAAAHPCASYRGFSDAALEHATLTRPNTKVAGVKKKGAAGGGGTAAKKPPPLQPKKQDAEGLVPKNTHPPPIPERPKKVARVIASGDKRSSKSGARNIITTSSWRAGQELAMKQLGIPSKSRNRSAAQGEGAHNDFHKPHLSATPPEGETGKRNRQPDGAEATVVVGGSSTVNFGGGDVNVNSNDQCVDEVVANSRTLSEDARNVLHELQQGSVPKIKSPSRPAVKRKAPKSTEPEKHQQPSEKARHYDPDSVRKFMAKQKVERLKKQQEEKLANQIANEKRQQMMNDLAELQKKKAAKSAALGRGGDGDRKRKKDERNMTGKDRGTMDTEEHDHDHEDDSTLTGDTEEDSTPQITPRESQEDTGKQRKQSRDHEEGVNLNQHALTSATAANSGAGANNKFIEFRGQMLNLDVDSAVNRFSQVLKQRFGQGGVPDSTPGSTLSSGARTGPSNLSEFQLQGSNTVFARPWNPDGSETAFALGTTNSVARTNEERKQAIKATAMTLQSRLAEERRKLEDLNLGNTHQHNSDPEFASRYSRMTGSQNNEYAVFTSDLPGSQAVVRSGDAFERQDQAAVRIQAAYRGHNVRQALHWELPSGQTFGQRLKGSGRVSKLHDGDDDASELTETSSFSEITATEASEAGSPSNIPGNRRTPSSRHTRHVEGSPQGKPVVATYKPPSQNFWSDSKADPYSVMSVFSRQNRYLAAGSRQADMPVTPLTTTPSTSIITATTTSTSSPAQPSFVGNLDLTSLKQPVITSTERVVYGQTTSGQPVIAKARYTRLEATVGEKADNTTLKEQWRDENMGHSLSLHSESVPVLPHKQSYSQQQLASVRSNDPASRSERLNRQASERSGRSENAYTMSFESSDDEAPAASKKYSINQHLSASGYARQVSDAGQETDVSQMSEDEPRAARSKLDSAVASRADVQAATQDKPSAAREKGQEDGRLSPNSLANKFSANLNYLESMEESLRQVVGMERTRAVALAQQESVSLAQVIKARQQEHNTELRNLQLQAQREAKEATQQLDDMRGKHAGKAVPTAAALLEKEDNRRPESWSYTLSASRSGSREGKEDLSQSPGNRRIKRSSATTSLGTVSKVLSSRTSREQSSVASVKTAEDSRNDSDSSIKTASDIDVHDSHSLAESVPEEVPDEEDSYSMSFDESITEVLPSESHRKELRRQSGEHQAGGVHDTSTSHVTPYGDLSSLFVGENSFNQFTAEMVRQIMREEEYRAQHQAALLNLREKALKEKAKAELAWLQQLKQKPLDKGADEAFPNLDKKEKRIKRNLQEQQAEIRRLQEANKVANQERQRLLQQHEEIARIKQNTQETLQKLKGTPAQGRLARPSEVHTEDEIEEVSDASEGLKDSKSDSEMYREKSPSHNAKGEKGKIEKQQKLRLDEKYMTAREQKLHERKKHAKELLEWKKRLDAEEEKIFKLEKKAIQAWESKNAEKKKEKEETPVKKASKLAKQVSLSKKDDSHVISDRMLSSMHDELDGGATAATRSHTNQGSISEVISTQLSGSKSETSGDKKSRSRFASKDKERSPGASGSESSIPEEVPTGTREEKQKVHDSSDDTLINSSANDDYADTFEHDGTSSVTNRKKSPVGRLLPHGNSPLPSPWSRKTGSESESEDSISHTETMSDTSDYEVRIRQLSDELRRRRKEVEILKKERSKRQKEKFKAQEESLKKQLDAYNNYIQQLKNEKDDLEHEAQPPKSAVRPQIKQPRVGNQIKTKRNGEELASHSSSFEDMKDATDSNQTSPSVDGKDVKVSPVDEKAKKKATVSLMDRISEGSESQSDKSGTSGKAKILKKEVEDVSEKTASSSVQEVIEEASQIDSIVSEKTASSGLKIQTGTPAPTDKVQSRPLDSGKDDDVSYSMDFSDIQSSLAHSHSKVPLGDRSQGWAAGEIRGRSDAEISEHIEEPTSVKSQSVSSHLELDVKSSAKVGPENVGSAISPPTTGIQESDSETESRVNSYHTSAKSEGSSRPSSERSVGSISYSPEDDEEEEDIISYGSDKAPVKSSQKLLPPVSGGASGKTDEDISEHISASLPSISERQHSHSGSVHQKAQDILDSVLGYDEDEDKEDEDEKTPVPTPREMAPTPVPDDEEEEENASLLMTDPLTDFHLGDRVLVWGRRPGVLRYKGKVDFSPGIWAGVEMDAAEGDSDGMHEGKRYFSCGAGHGVMVHGSDIMAASEQSAADVMAEIGEARSPDESVTTDQDDSHMGDADTVDVEKTVLPAGDASMLHSTPLSSPYPQGSNKETEKPTATPVKRDLTQMADSITDQLTSSIIEDTVDAVGKISSKKTPPPTLPKPAKKVPDTAVPESKDSSEKTGKPTDTSPSKLTTDKTTDGVMKSLLEEAISDMVKIKKKKAASIDKLLYDSHAGHGIVNGELDDADMESFLREGEDEDDDHIQDNDSGLSLDPVQRPGSPVPGDSPTARDHQELKELNDDMAGLFGEYIDDDLGFEQSTNSTKPPPPYPGAEQSEALPSDRSVPVPEEIPPVVPHTKETIAPIVAQAVDIFWNQRRYGESLDEVTPPASFLSDDEDEASDALTAQSRRSWRRMLFDLTGEIVRDIYKDEDKPDPPVWEKAKHKSQKFFKGVGPPTTVDKLQPIVQSAVFKLLDINGTSKQNMVNKWNVRKKKDAVDAVLVQELGEEEKGWVDYTDDELNLKMSLAESLFDSLLLDTVQALNGIYQKRQHSHV